MTILNETQRTYRSEHHSRTNSGQKAIRGKRVSPPGYDVLWRFHRPDVHRVQRVRRHAGGWNRDGLGERHRRGVLRRVQLPHESQRHLQGVDQFLAQRRTVRRALYMELPVRNLVHRSDIGSLRLAANGRQVHNHGHAGHLGILPMQMGNLQIALDCAYAHQHVRIPVSRRAFPESTRNHSLVDRFSSF